MAKRGRKRKVKRKYTSTKRSKAAKKAWRTRRKRYGRNGVKG